MPADSHCHLNDPAFDIDRGEVIESIETAGMVHLLNVGYDLPTSHKALALAHRYPYMYASAGIHPHNASSVDDTVLDELRKLLAYPQVVAVGETGLDYFRDRSPREDQQRSFRAHLALARSTGRPVIIHCRDAMDDCLKILEEEEVGKIGGVMHCFAGSPEEAEKTLELGLYISFAGNVTYPKAGMLRDSMAVVPGHRLLLETDSPYLAPQKKRGKRNDPTLLRYVLETAAKVRSVTIADMERIAVNNFEELFLNTGAEGKIAYQIRDSLYINVTQACSNECYFCVRFHSDTVQGHNLRLAKDPSAEQMIEAIGDPTKYGEVVFCGYGEPTIRLEQIKQVAKAVKDKGGVTRLNTNGHGNHLAKRNIVPELKGVIDSVSVSLNAADSETYNKICKPLIKNAWNSTVEFIKEAKAGGLDVTASIVAIPGVVDEEQCRTFVEDELKVDFRVRHYNLVG